VELTRPVPSSINTAPRVEQPLAFLYSAGDRKWRLPLVELAMSALSFPEWRRQFLILMPHYSTDPVRETLVSASFTKKTKHNNQTVTWSPTSDLSADLLSTFFEGSKLAADGIRYHCSKAKAILFSLMVATFHGEESSVAKALSDIKSVGKDNQVLLFPHNQLCVKKEDMRTPVAVLNRPSQGPRYFSFLDDKGILIGPRINLPTRT
jgi:hypothetical protein